MKKIFVLTFIIMALFCEVSYGAEYLNPVEFTQKSIDDSVMWSGREWITGEYPPKISQDAVEFTEIEGSGEVKAVLIESYDYAYVWTGNDYLVYQTNHIRSGYYTKPYLYRLSEDFDSILNIYEVPNWINYLSIVGGKIFIATEDVIPVYSSDMQRVMGERHLDYEIYCSNDCLDWKKLDFEFDDLYRPSMYSMNDRLFISVYCNTSLMMNPEWTYKRFVYDNNSNSEIIYENIIPKFNHKVGEYFCTISKIEGEENYVLCFSADGIYYINMVVDNANDISGIFLMGNDVVIARRISGRYKYYTCNKEDIYSQLREKLPSDPVYVRLNGNYLGFEYPPVIESDRTLVPMRFLFEQMGADVEWNQERKEATATMGDTVIRFGIDNTTATVNGEEVTMDVPARLINDKTMVPLRFLSENMGYTVDWDGETRTAVIE